MIVLWILAGLATALSAMLVLAGARRGQDAVEDTDAEAGARELAELDRLKGRGLMDEATWAAARAEAGRRLLAHRAKPVVTRSGDRDRLWVLMGVAATAAVALGLYAVFGRAGLADQPYAARVEQWAESTEPLEPAQVAAVLTREAALAPENRRVLTMLGAARFQAGDAVGAASAFRRALEQDPEDAQSWARLGESLVRANDGEVGADAEAAFREAIRRDPDQLGALYFLGEAALARGDAEGVRILWTPLIRALEPSDPRRMDLETRMAAALNGDAAS